MRITEHNYLSFLEQHNYDLYLHSIRVSRISKIIGNQFLLVFNDKINMTDLEQAALFHDFGKLFIPDEILNKPSSLSDNEYKIIKHHSRIGATYFYDAISKNDYVYKGILEHHEREDGSGYPNRLTSDKISIQGKIIAVCDVYDSLVSSRCYKDSWSYDRVKGYFINNTKLFDKRIVNVLFLPETQKKIDETIYLDLI